MDLINGASNKTTARSAEAAIAVAQPRSPIGSYVDKDSGATVRSLST